uniref:ER membrane protein complex subunit 6 n=1 Tax=Parastrongyloides trichosuri TaxID=131310 RepID=A0A0N4Z3K7_PARTI
MSSKVNKIIDEKKSKKDKVLINGIAVRNNVQVLEYSRTLQSLLAGLAAGIIGLQSFGGVAFYFLTLFIQSGLWLVKADFKVQQYFLQSHQLITHSLVGGFFTYILAWVFFYGLVHVF